MAEEVEMTKRNTHSGTRKRKSEPRAPDVLPVQRVNVDTRGFWRRVADFFRRKP
jgi:hypothetical protein